MQLTTIPYITLWAVKFDQMVDFYRDQLQLPIEYSDENFIQFATQGTKLYIHRLGSAPSLREHAIEIHFDVPDVDAAYTELQQRGVVFEDPLPTVPGVLVWLPFVILKALPLKSTGHSTRMNQPRHIESSSTPD